jgi:hypothetical protein
MTPVGYSGTPLPRKLGLKPAMQLCLLDAPDTYEQLLGGWPDGVLRCTQADRSTDMVHVFVVHAALLSAQLTTLRQTLRPDAVVWVSWPKKASKVPTDITEDTIRSLALPLGFVDVKVCAVSEVWSGLKLVVRKTLRQA